VRKIIQMSTGMYTVFNEETDEFDQLYAIIILCDDGTMWEHREKTGWKNIDTESITNYIKPR
jgi:hypothetical protein